MKSKRGVFSDIQFLGAPFDKNGSFWSFKLLKTHPKVLYGLKYFKIIIFLLFWHVKSGGGCLVIFFFYWRPWRSIFDLSIQMPIKYFYYFTCLSLFNFALMALIFQFQEFSSGVNHTVLLLQAESILAWLFCHGLICQT